MAKEYKAKLTLQDNWNQVIDKAIDKTGKLLKEARKMEKMKINPEVNVKTNKALMKQLEKDLNKLKQSNINIKTKLDSSFKSTVNAIEKAVPTKKVISITARENVTKTLNNVEREVFTRTNKVSNIIKGSFSGIGSSIGGATSTLSNFVSRLTTASNIASVLSRKSGGSNIATAIAGGSLLSSAVAGGVSGMVVSSSIAKKFKMPNPDFSKWLDGFSKVSLKMKGTMGKAFQDVVTGAKNKLSGIKTFATEAMRINNLKGLGYRGAWDKESNFGKMIFNQKVALKGMGVQNPLPQYQFTGAMADDKLVSGYAKVPSKLSKAFSSAFSKISNMASNVGQKIKGGINNAILQVKTSSLYQKFAPIFSKIKDSANLTGTKIKFAFQRGVYGASSVLAKLVVAGANVASRVKTAFDKLSSAIPGPIKKGVALGVTAIKKIVSATAKVAGKTFKFTIKAIDKATSVIKSIASKALGLAKIGLGALTVGATVGVKGLAEKESNLVSIEHFMGVADEQNGGNKTKEQLNTQANKYFDGLQNLANTTPFENGDINKAGTRAIQMANGDTDYAMTMTKLAADMGALNNTDATSAIEALFDAKNGEFERLKEYGFKVTQKDFKALVGKGENDDLTAEETEQAFQKLVNGQLQTTFEGGAEKLGQTLGGKFSTVTGKLKKGLSDIAEAFAPKMKDALDKVSVFMDKIFAKDDNGNFTNVFVSGFISGVEKSITFVSKLINALKDIYPQVKTAIEPIKQAFSNVFGNISMDDLINGIIGALNSLISFATPIIQAFSNVFQTIAPVVGEVVGKVVAAFESLSPAFATVIEMITPVLQTFLDWFGKVADFITEHSDTINSIIQTLGEIWGKVWGIISKAVEIAWDIMSPVLEDLLELLGGVLGAINKFLDGVGKVGSWIGDKWSDFSKFISGDTGSTGSTNNTGSTTSTTKYNNNSNRDSRAVGMDTIPYNNYPINAHRGEILLTRAEANQYKSEKNRNTQANNKNMNVVINVNGNNNAEHVANVVYTKLMQASLNMA